MANQSFTDFLKNVTKRLINTTSTYFAELQAVILYNSSEAELLTVANPGNVAITGTVPVSGTITQAQMEAALQAAPVPVDGPLTDAEMRASPVDVDVDAITVPTVIYNGVSTVAAAATAEILAPAQVIQSGVRIKALIANTGNVYVGDAAVSAANGYVLDAGEEVFIEIANLATVYLAVSVNGEGASYVAS